uniref:Ubiquitin-protein ligase E3A N-terminal zinc-binding domain-containing protein n=1 Tax=Globisporangium ultimum (strain ATCC 200006 / CBS 805.95 / DAOM BR144) TaxID=431595 RepID=K3WNF9_GLOUD
MCEDSEYAYAQQLVASYFHMLTIGCQLTQCVNPQCTSAAMLAAPSPTDAAIQSIYLARTAPIPICAPILAHFGLMEHDERGESGREEFPETEDDDDDALEDVASGSDTVVMLCSTPRRRLSSAVELALTFTNCSNSQESDDAEEDRWEQQQQKASATRRLSLPKQKLLDALTRAFERTNSPTSTAKSSARGRES